MFVKCETLGQELMQEFLLFILDDNRNVMRFLQCAL